MTEGHEAHKCKSSFLWKAQLKVMNLREHDCMAVKYRKQLLNDWRCLLYKLLCGQRSNFTSLQFILLEQQEHVSLIH